MTIIFSKITPSTVAKIKNSEAFLAAITENFVKDKDKHVECSIAAELDKPMYAIVEENTKWDKLEKAFLWRKIYYLKDMEPEEIMEDIKKDLEFLRKVGK